MKAIQTFLSELTKKITTTTSLITELKENKNSVLSINNILFKYNINHQNIPVNKLIEITNEDIKEIYTQIGAIETEPLVNGFNEKKEIIKLYEKITKTHGDMENPPQYNSAVKELEKTSKLITSYLNKYKDEQTNQIKALEEKVDTYTYYMRLFKGDQLVEPIFDMLEFDDLLGKCGFDLETKWKIKKIIGKSNYELITQKGITQNESSKVLDKYRIILERKKQEYKEMEEYQETIKTKNISINIDNIKEIIINEIKETKKDPELIKNSLICFLLEKEIQNFDKKISDNKTLKKEEIDSAILMCERLLVISREQIIYQEKPKEIQVETPEPIVKSLASKTDDDLLIEQIETIIKEENDLLHSYSQNDTTRLTELSNLHSKYVVEKNSNEKNTVTLALLAETLRVNLIFFRQILINKEKNPSEYEGEYKTKLSDLNEYLATYNIVKENILKHDNNQTKIK